MSSQSTVAIAAVLLAALGSVPAQAQNIEPVGPVLPAAAAAPETGPLPAELSLGQALIEAERRSPDLAAARAEIAAARGRLEHAGLRYNPQLSVELEYFGGSGDRKRVVSGTSGSVRVDLRGRRIIKTNHLHAQLKSNHIHLAANTN